MKQIKTTTQNREIKLLKEIGAAVKRLGMYPPEHPAATKATEKPYLTLQEIFKDAGHVTISQVDDKIIVNGKSIQSDLLPESLRAGFDDQNINGLTLFNSLTKEEFGKFLNFLLKPLDKNAPKRSLTEFLSKNNIGAIQLNELRYELISDDEVVVKSEILEGADLKAQISKIIKENPDLVKDILLNGSPKQESYKEKLGTEVNLDQLNQEIHLKVKNLSDDDLLALLASGLEVTLRKYKTEHKSSAIGEATKLVHQLLQDREKKKLLPEVKKILAGGGLLDEKYFDFIFDEKWLKSQTILDEFVKQVGKLGREEVDFERFVFLSHRVIDSEEEKLRLYAIDKLLLNLDSENHETRRLSVLALVEILSRLIAGKMEVEFVYIQDRLYERVKDQLLTAHLLKDVSQLVKIVFSEMIQKEKFEEAKKIISEYNTRLSEEVSYHEEVREVAKDFLKGVSGESTLSFLTSQLKEGRPFRSTRVIEKILESLDRDMVAKQLVGIFTADDRATRMSALRVLSKLGQSSITALSCFLSNRKDFVREKGTLLLINEHWYKVRNTIYVLGNIPEKSSVEVLVKLSSDPDPRVRLEVVKALERIGRKESVDALMIFLRDGDDQVRKNAITSLVAVGNKRCLRSLIEHFHHKGEDKTFTLTAIGRIGGEETIRFLLRLLSEEDFGIKHLSSRQKEEIKITALDILGRIGSLSSPQVGNLNLEKEIEAFLRYRKRGIKAFLIKDRVAETAGRVLKMIKTKAQRRTSPYAVG